MAWRALTGAQWERIRPHLPREKRRPQGGRLCWRRLRQWEESGALLALWRGFLNELNDRQKIR